MKYLDCPLKYFGQTGRAFHMRCKEHIQAIRITAIQDIGTMY
jgi:hypothetical protein